MIIQIDSHICFNLRRQEEGQTSGEKSPERLQKQIDKAVGGWKTSSSQFNAVAGKIRTSGE